MKESNELNQVELNESQNTDVQLEDLVKTYLTIRAHREKIAREFEEADSALKNEMSEIEHVMLNTCNSINAESIKTGSGTVVKSTKETYTCGDWTNFKQFILENQARSEEHTSELQSH